jgi:hypothetical protein
LITIIPNQRQQESAVVSLQELFTAQDIFTELEFVTFKVRGSERRPLWIHEDDPTLEPERVLQISIQQLFFNEKECFVINLRDITAIQNLSKIKSEAKMVSLYTSTISHEMLIPLKNMIAVSGQIENEFPVGSAARRQTHLVKISSQMLLT